MTAAKTRQETPISFTAPISSRGGGGSGMAYPGVGGGPGGGTWTGMKPLEGRSWHQITAGVDQGVDEGVVSPMAQLLRQCSCTNSAQLARW